MHEQVHFTVSRHCLNAVGCSKRVRAACSLTVLTRAAGKSNSGEGGEDPVRWDVVGDADDKGVSATFPYLRGLRDGDIATSRIKQVRRSLEAFYFAGKYGVGICYLIEWCVLVPAALLAALMACVRLHPLPTRLRA